MKRIGDLMLRIIERQNLERAFCFAARGRRNREGVRRYMDRSEFEMRELRDGLSKGNYPLGRFHRFVVHDPKTRVIHAAPFRERVMHHAVMNVCGPILEGRAVADIFACSPGGRAIGCHSSL